jgi:hypothetical protein
MAMPTSYLWFLELCAVGAIVATDICPSHEVDPCANGQILSSESYNPNSDCGVLLLSADGQFVQYVLTSFDVEAHFDHVTIYDGADADAPVIGRFAGNDTPPPLTSSGNAMFVRIQSDESTQGAGFAGKTLCVNPAGCTLAKPELSHGALGTCHEKLAHGEACRLACAEGFTDMDVELTCSAGKVTRSCATLLKMVLGNIAIVFDKFSFGPRSARSFRRVPATVGARWGSTKHAQ